LNKVQKSSIKFLWLNLGNLDIIFEFISQFLIWVHFLESFKNTFS
jgi:hypothetical protein